MLALHTGTTPGCQWTATTFHSLTAMNYSHTLIHVRTQAHACKNNVKATVGIWKYMHNMTIAYALKKYHDAVHSAKINPNGVFIM